MSYSCGSRQAFSFQWRQKAKNLDRKWSYNGADNHLQLHILNLSAYHSFLVNIGCLDNPLVPCRRTMGNFIQIEAPILSRFAKGHTILRDVIWTGEIPDNSWKERLVDNGIYPEVVKQSSSLSYITTFWAVAPLSPFVMAIPMWPMNGTIQVRMGIGVQTMLFGYRHFSWSIFSPL